jgi:hypothetical protein
MTTKEQKNQHQRDYRAKRKRDKKLATLQEIRTALSQHRKGIDPVSDALVTQPVLNYYAEEKRLWTPAIAKAFSPIEKLIDISFKASVDQLFGLPLSKFVQGALGAFSRRGRERGITYEDLVLLALEQEFRHNTFCNFDRQVKIGEFIYDGCFTVDGRIRADLEVSLNESPSKLYSDIFRHGHKPFFQVVRGYSLNKPLVDRLLKHNCQPVVTVGTKCSGPISFDEMITEMKARTRNAVAERIKNKGTVPPGTTVA